MYNNVQQQSCGKYKLEIYGFEMHVRWNSVLIAYVLAYRMCCCNWYPINNIHNLCKIMERIYILAANSTSTLTY